MKILFIGGTGTISTACTQLCASENLDLYLLNRGNRTHRVPKNVKLLRGDIRNGFKEVQQLLKNHEWDCVVDWIAYDEKNIERDIELFSKKTTKFVFISSTSVYQKPLSADPLKESHPIGNAFWDYAEKKAACERILRQQYLENAFPAVIVRPGSVYSEFVLPTNIPGLSYGALERMRFGKPLLIHGDGKSLWTFTFNEDFAQAFVPLLKRNDILGESFHITSDEKIPWIEIYQKMGEVFGFEPQFTHVDPEKISKLDPELGATFLGDKSHTYLFDNQKIKSFVPFFKAEFNLKEGLSRCREWSEKFPDQVFFNPKSNERINKILEQCKH